MGLLLAGCAPADPAATPDPAEHRVLLPDGACAPCHPAQAAAFAGSPMAYSAFSPVVSALDLALAATAGDPFVLGSPGAADGFCSGCHAPVLARQGLGSDGRRPFRELLPAADQGGITCDFCHRVTAITGEANAALTATPGVEKQGPFADPVPNAFHTSAGADHITDPAFCGACHDVRPPHADAVAGTPDARLEDLFSEWKASPWADADHPWNPLRGQPGIAGVHDGAEAQGEVVTCQDCHMSLYPSRGFRDVVEYGAAFAGVDPASLTRKADKLYPAGPAAVPEDGRRTPRRRVAVHAMVGASHPVVPFEDKVGVEAHCATATDAFGGPACVRQRRDAMLKAALTLDLSETPTTAQRRAPLEVTAWIENVGAGHNVPAGFSQEREVWVALTVTDAGRTCEVDLDCEDLVEAPRFFDDPPFGCAVRGPDGQLDATLRPDDRTWRRRARAERSGVCEAGRCVVYRSGYLIDRDGDGRVEDEDLRHELVEMDAEAFPEACALPGPDADLRSLGLDQGLVLFTNQFQRLAVDAEGAPVEEENAHWLAPTAAPYVPGPDAPPVLDQDPAERRSPYASERAVYTRHRYRTATPGHPPPVANPLEANRFFDGNALRPFEPRLARYAVTVPVGVVGPLVVEARVRF
ncbi:MAG: hypothetical protein KC549_04040, partial [Myxococcales bacterium]|nr:hypothetical protein [Myxococcales bacterium]